MESLKTFSRKLETTDCVHCSLVDQWIVVSLVAKAAKMIRNGKFYLNVFMQMDLLTSLSVQIFLPRVYNNADTQFFLKIHKLLQLKYMK